uniref:MCM3-associated protein n=1 Tax=Anthurium amnicola TaxID=1678845 RepID=A0A1D1XUH4_9ARAE
MEPSGFEKGSGSGLSALKGGVRPVFGSFPASPSPPSISSPDPAAVWRMPPPPFESRPQHMSPQPRQLPRRPDASPHLVSHQKSPPGGSIQQFPSDVFHASANNVGTSFSSTSAKFQSPKRIRSPPIPSANVPFSVVSHFADMDAEREMRAKAKRLARFQLELSQPAGSPSDFGRKSSSGSKNNQIQPNKVKLPVGDSIKRSGDPFDEGPVSDYEGSESCPAICGLCPDMCPESEREERQRKGDLDRYERLDGERNQTSIYLAVKKYNRTAERDADLIRPLPVLQRTVDYLLNLLNRPYDDQFLGLYNFLWDRMRAIRMDLRMQHIFNRDAINMLEQMIRLHIIAMHELSESTKGEGFSEGFDAHLNIEQMNKTSVELFQMYDDHRKRGSIIPTEKEFRGYYALLKLDKHPGYKVEPAELSLDLAKMAPEIRCTAEIIFARDVARACRTSNFIAFFRLARKATYLQACLMHAHFSKLRTQALASLHSGLQSNQGIPVAHVVTWVAMEGEIESLLEYHGFSTKRFEELYMVKEGPFLNSDVDYPTKCSQLVKLKRSKRVVDDVRHGQMLVSPDEGRKSWLAVTNMIDPRHMESHETEAGVDAADVKMLDYEGDPTSTMVMQPQTIIEEPLPNYLKGDAEYKLGDIHIDEMLDVVVDKSLCHRSLPNDDELLIELDRDRLLNDIVASNVNEGLMQTEAPGRPKLVQTMESSLDGLAVTAYADGGQLMQMLRENDEAARARLKLILRMWKRRSTKKREMRERRQSLADAALSSLSLGPPVRQNEVPGIAIGDFNIDYVVRARYVRHEKSWSRLNISEVVAPILSTRNPLARCLFWKLAFCLQINGSESKSNHLVLPWLLWKLMGIGRENDEEHVIYSAGLTIWKKSSKYQVEVGVPESCCYSVVREVVFDDNMPVAQDGLMVGLSAVIFLVLKSIPWAIQKLRLDNVLASIPSGSSLPLLILSSDAGQSVPHCHTIIVNSLGLKYLDKTIISDFSIVFLDGNHRLEYPTGFFSDDHLKGGLWWLAENSPLQPCLRLVKIRDLVLSFLNSSVYALERMKYSEVDPDHCVSLFNEALDRSTKEISFAADKNKNCWPGPEINLLNLPNDFRFVNMLPSSDWSDASNIEPLIKAISSCKLPSFPSDLSWLKQGSDGGSDIISQKLALEQCLLGYLTETVGLLDGNLAAKEASGMLQKGTGVQLCAERYYIIPRWVMIFKRIYHWRLTTLSNGKFTSAYVLEKGIPGHAELWSADDMRQSMTDAELTNLEDTLLPQGFQQLHSALTQLSLDELIEVSCSIPSAQQLNQSTRWNKHLKVPII